MRVFITGATGYIGSNLVKRLIAAGKYTVSVLVRPTSDLSPLKAVANTIDIIECTPNADRIEQAVVRAKPDVVVHLAASTLLSPSSDQIHELIEANILFGTLLVDTIARHNVGAFVNTGTFSEYCNGDKVDYCPANLYAATKRAFKDILRYYEDTKQLRLITLELFNVYGPHDLRPKVFSVFRESMTSGKPLAVSPGQQVMDMVYIDDVVDAYEKAIQFVLTCKSTNSLEVAIGTGTGLSLHAMADIYAECAKRPLNLEWGGRSYRPREIMYAVADTKKAKELLGWEPKFNLKRGIQLMLQQENLNKRD